MSDLPPPPPPHEPGTVWVPPAEGHAPPPPPSGGHQPYGPWPGPPRNRRAIAAALVATVVVIAAAVTVPVVLLGGSHPRTSGGGPTGGTSPQPSPSGTDSHAAAIYQAALAATRASVGCHYVAVTSGGVVSQTIVGDAGQKDGTQVITVDSTYGTEQFTLVLFNGIVYFKGNVPALQDQIGAPAARLQSLQNTWISVSQGDGPYSVLQPGITLADQAQELVLTPRSQASTGNAIRIDGVVPPQQGAPAGTGHVDVATGTNLPMSYVTTISGGGATVTSTTTYSAWGTAPVVTVPAGATTWASLGASQPPGGYGSGGTGGSAPGSATPIPL